MSRHHTRRRFLQYSAATAGAGYFVNPSTSTAAEATSDQLRLAIIGTGNKGWHNVQQLTHENIAVLCDIDAELMGKASAQYPKARQYRDYRKMLDSEHRNIDAVVVSTADHTHAPATSVALDLGKPVYCEKPLTHTVSEARAIAELAAKHQVATQMGTQIHAGENYRRVVELIRHGTIGPINEVHCWCNKGWSDGRFESGNKPVPTHIDWDLWLGPAKPRPYCPNIHPANWRRFWEYGTGTFGDMACHIMDLPFWALDLRHPTTVECTGPEVHPDGAPAWARATYQFPSTDDRPGLTLTWTDGGEHVDVVKNTHDDAGTSLSTWGLGVLFVGERGMLASNYNQHYLLPQEKFVDFQAPEPLLPPSVGHWKEWTDAIRTGAATTCNFEYSGRLTETVLLGVAAYRSGNRLEWDAETLTAKNTSAADMFLTKKYRSGFEVVGLKS